MSEDKLEINWLRDTVINFLVKRPNKEFSVPYIARWVFEEHPDKCKLFRGFERYKNDKERISRIRGQISQKFTDNMIQGKEERIKEKIENGTRYCWYEEAEGSVPIKSNEEVKQKEKSKIEERKDEKKLEEYLHEPLCQFLYSEFGIFCKEIDDKTSSNAQEKGSNKWLHPDIVGIEYPKWERDVRSCSTKYSSNKHNLWSFEIKLDISKGTVREYFFQAVANSSWANFGYLVVGDIKASQKPLVMKELRMLSALHGIGCIKLDKDSPSESDILVPAIKRQDIDWYSVNRLAVENPDFREYMASVECMLETGKVRYKDWAYHKNLEKENDD